MGIQQQEGALFFASGIDNSGLQTGANQAIGIVQTLANKITSLNPFVALGTAATAAFAKIINDATRFEMEYRTLMTEVMTISSEVSENYLYFSDELLRIARETGALPAELARGYYSAISASFDATQSLKLMDVSARAAAAGFIKAGEAVDGITTVLNAWNLDVREADNVSNTFFKTVEAGKTTFGELAKSISQVAPTAAEVGISFADTGEALAEMTKQGVPTTQAVTALNQAILSTIQVLGDDAFKENNLREAFQKVYDMAGGSFNTLKEQMGSVVGVKALLQLTGEDSAEIMSGYEKFYDGLEGATARAYAKVETLTDSNMAKIKNIVTDNIRGLGVGMVNLLENLSGAILNVMDKSVNPIENVTAAMAKQRQELGYLFNLVQNQTVSDQARVKAMEQINSQYGQYLSHLLNEKSSIDEITAARQEATKALMAEIAVKQSQMEIEQIIGDLYVTQNKKLEGIRDAIAKDFGPAATAPFNEAFEELMQRAEELGGVPNALFKDIYFSFVQPLRSLKFDYEGFRGISMAVAKERIEAKSEIEKLGEIVNTYQSMYDKLFNTGAKNEGGAGGGKGGSNMGFDFTKYQEDLNNARAEYSKYAALQSEETRKQFLAESKFMDSTWTEWEQYLHKRYEEAKTTTEKILLELQAAADGFDLSEALTLGRSVEYIIPIEGIKKAVVEARPQLIQWQDQIKKINEEIQNATDKRVAHQLIKERELIQGKINEWTRLPDTVKGLYDKLENAMQNMRNRELKEVRKHIDLELREYKKGSDEYNDLMEKRQKINLQMLKNTSDTLRELPSILGDLSNAFALLDSDIGETLNKVGNLVGSFSEIGAGLASGNPMAMLGGAASLVTGFIALFDTTAKDQEKMARMAEQFRHELMMQNRELEKQINLTKQLSGQQRLTSELRSIALVNKQLADMTSQINDIVGSWASFRQGQTAGDSRGGLAGIEEVSEQYRELQDRYDELIAKRRELMQEFVGTNTDNISSSIVEGLQDGLSAVDAFAKSFEDAMKGAILRSFELKYILPIAEKMFDWIYNEMEGQNTADRTRTPSTNRSDSGSGTTRGGRGGIATTTRGGATTDPQEYLDPIINLSFDELTAWLGEEGGKVQEAWETMQDLLDSMGLGTSDRSPMEGAIARAITEETGSELLGLWHITSIDIREIRNSISSVILGVQEMVVHLSQINENTSNTAANTAVLSDIRDSLDEINNRSSRGTGI